MSILNGITQIGMVVNTTRGIIEALKPRPRPAAIHHEAGETRASSGSKARTDFSSELSKAAARFIELRDANRDGVLDAVELGLGKDVFSRIDTNADGRISLAEVSQAASVNAGLLNSGGSTTKV
jgi:hypothetical protein